LRVDVGLPDLHGDKRHLAVGGERTGATAKQMAITL
jgi:hypothetical protein